MSFRTKEESLFVVGMIVGIALNFIYRSELGGNFGIEPSLIMWTIDVLLIVFLGLTMINAVEKCEQNSKEKKIETFLLPLSFACCLLIKPIFMINSFIESLDFNIEGHPCIIVLFATFLSLIISTSIYAWSVIIGNSKKAKAETIEILPEFLYINLCEALQKDIQKLNGKLTHYYTIYNGYTVEERHNVESKIHKINDSIKLYKMISCHRKPEAETFIIEMMNVLDKQIDEMIDLYDEKMMNEIRRKSELMGVKR